MNTKNFIVTGGCGFIGSHIVESLLDMGHKVIVIDNLETSSVRNININHENISFYEKDLSDVDDVNDVISLLGYQKNKIDGAFHVAAKARIQPSIENPGRTFSCNVQGTFNVLELCRALNIGSLIYSASSSAYGSTDKIPNRIDDETNCLNPYALTKFVGEELCKTWSACYGINTVCLRYFNVYGSRSQLVGQYAPVMGIFFRQKLKEMSAMTITGDGEQRRDFTHVSDVVNANLLAMEKSEKVSGKIFNIGCGKNYSINDVAKFIGGETRYIPERQNESRKTLADITETKELLGWNPNVSLEEGIELMRKHYEKLFK